MPQLDPPLIDVYLLHWHAPEWCARAAASVLESRDVRLRCFVIDNGSSGGAALAQALDPRVRVVATPRNIGYTGAANVALTRAFAEEPRAEFVVVAAHDLQVRPDTFAELSKVARADPAIGILGPVLTAPAQNAGGSWRGWRAKPTSSWNDSIPFNEREWVSGTLLFIRPECVAQIGGLDERLGSYVEDVDICLRARDAGWRVGVATAARAAGLGSASKNVTVFVDVNSVMLAVKRRGLHACVAILARYVYWIGRGIVAACAPRRARDRRRASLVHARDHARAIGRVLRGWRKVRAIARDPDGGAPRLE
ncbi:MAG TPA: glycosyltransferase family 2 protein [Acidimicrobiia bacterium]|nr:glycosyltransferase family 2 protein [Acidimicrobiia bacterium]